MKQIHELITLLFVPGDQPRRFEKAAYSGADAVIIDLEDAVAPGSKHSARDALRGELPKHPILVRINARGTPWYRDDLDALAGLAIAGIVLPKAEFEYDGQTDLPEAALGRPIVALIETARGLSQARRIAASPGVTRLAFGSVDFCVDVGCANTRESLLSARSELVLASRLAGIAPPIDGVTTVLGDDDLARADARMACDLGFGGKLCVHPRQIAPVRAGFEPTSAEVVWALSVTASGEGVTAVAGEMIDAPVRARAVRILTRLQRARSDVGGVQATGAGR